MCVLCYLINISVQLIDTIVTQYSNIRSIIQKIFHIVIHSTKPSTATTAITWCEPLETIKCYNDSETNNLVWLRFHDNNVDHSLLSLRSNSYFRFVAPRISTSVKPTLNFRISRESISHCFNWQQHVSVICCLCFVSPSQKLVLRMHWWLVGASATIHRIFGLTNKIYVQQSMHTSVV